MTRSSGLVICVAVLAGCTDDGAGSFGDELTDPQVPARGTADVQTWLAAGYYRAWHCEAAPHPGRSPSPHGGARICNNDALSVAASAAAAAEPLPVGAAAVKEIYSDGRIVSFAVSRKLTEGKGGDRWYWYEGNAEKVYANGEGVDGCTSCHVRADRDYVFTLVP